MGHLQYGGSQVAHADEQQHVFYAFCSTIGLPLNVGNSTIDGNEHVYVCICHADVCCFFFLRLRRALQFTGSWISIHVCAKDYLHHNAEASSVRNGNDVCGKVRGFQKTPESLAVVFRLCALKRSEVTLSCCVSPLVSSVCWSMWSYISSIRLSHVQVRCSTICVPFTFIKSKSGAGVRFGS